MIIGDATRTCRGKPRTQLGRNIVFGHNSNAPIRACFCGPNLSRKFGSRGRGQWYARIFVPIRAVSYIVPAM